MIARKQKGYKKKDKDIFHYNSFIKIVVVPGCGEVVWEFENPVEKLVGALSINDTHQPLRF